MPSVTRAWEWTANPHQGLSGTLLNATESNYSTSRSRADSNKIEEEEHIQDLSIAADSNRLPMVLTTESGWIEHGKGLKDGQHGDFSPAPKLVWL